MAHQLRITGRMPNTGVGVGDEPKNEPKTATRHPMPALPLDGGRDRYRPKHSAPPDPPHNVPLSGKPKQIVTWDHTAPAPEPPTLAPEDFKRGERK